MGYPHWWKPPCVKSLERQPQRKVRGWSYDLHHDHGGHGGRGASSHGWRIHLKLYVNIFVNIRYILYYLINSCWQLYVSIYNHVHMYNIVTIYKIAIDNYTSYFIYIYICWARELSALKVHGALGGGCVHSHSNICRPLKAMDISHVISQ